MARTFKIQSPRVRGDDVRAWQDTLNREFKRWGVDRNVIKEDGDYGIATRSATSMALKGLGIAQDRMDHGVTPWLRSKVRARRLSVDERARFIRRWKIRRDFVRKHNRKVSTPIDRITQDSWGWVPGVHDGIDLICEDDALLRAVVAGRIVRADAGGWWGKAPSGDVRLGDGIIILRVTEDVGPFRKGMNVCYGHAEHAKVKAGETVKAGQVIGHAGLAVVPHVHFMVNDNADTRGVGDRDPRVFYDYARKHG